MRLADSLDRLKTSAKHRLGLHDRQHLTKESDEEFLASSGQKDRRQDVGKNLRRARKLKDFFSKISEKIDKPKSNRLAPKSDLRNQRAETAIVQTSRSNNFERKSFLITDYPFFRNSLTSNSRTLPKNKPENHSQLLVNNKNDKIDQAVSANISQPSYQISLPEEIEKGKLSKFDMKEIYEIAKKELNEKINSIKKEETKTENFPRQSRASRIHFFDRQSIVNPEYSEEIRRSSSIYSKNQVEKAKSIKIVYDSSKNNSQASIRIINVSPTSTPCEIGSPIVASRFSSDSSRSDASVVSDRSTDSHLSSVIGGYIERFPAPPKPPNP